ncbi:MAG: hypothetical protein U9O94_02480 [Nanoarchaeota archaeon]|nr:hypothetical protein [Nanoarchaeota archaeon]
MFIDEEVVEEQEEQKNVISEKDGKVYAEVPDDEESEEHEDLEEKETEEKDEEEKDEKEDDKSEEEDIEEKEDKEKYKGKSTDELIQMLEDRDVTIGKQGSEMKKYKDADAENLSADQIKERLGSDGLKQAAIKLKKDIRSARSTLDNLDPDMDGEEKVKAAEKELNKLFDAQDALEIDLSQRMSEDAVNKKLASADNAKFLNEKRAEFKDKLGIGNKEFDEIIEASKSYVGQDGKLNLNILGKGMIDLKGFEGVNKLSELAGNSKARKEITKALEKGEKKISTTKKGGKRTRTILVTDDMSMHETKNIVGNMSDDELFENE